MQVVPLVVSILTKRSPRPTHVPRPPAGPTVDTTQVPWGIVLLVVAGVAIVGLIAYLSYVQTKRRRLGFMTMARQLGFDYSLQDPFGLLGQPFALFQKGDGRGIENVIWGAWQGLDVKAFDYWYYEESTDGKGHTSRSYSRFDCAIVPVGISCPHLTIERESFLTRLADALSFHDIEFENEEFNRRFDVKCQDKKFANDVVDARMMDWLIAHAEGYGVETVGTVALVAGPKIAPAALIQLIGTAKGFMDQIPAVVFSLYPKSG